MSIIIETPRLILREMRQSDFDALCEIMCDNAVMYAYEGAFTTEETQLWLDKQLARYAHDGHGLFAVTLRESGNMIGQCGLTYQAWKDRTVLEIGYLFAKAYWHCGYATEAARACRDYAFETLNAPSVCSIIRDTNIASQNVAKRNGMTPVDTWIKHYRGVDMPHTLFSVNSVDYTKTL